MNKQSILRNLPNSLSVFRFFGAFLLYFLYDIININYLVLAFLFLGLTDFLDGYYARKYHCTSKLGDILDKFSDKILLFCGLLIVCSNHIIFLFIIINFIYLFSREYLILNKINIINTKQLFLDKSCFFVLILIISFDLYDKENKFDFYYFYYFVLCVYFVNIIFYFINLKTKKIY